MLIQYRETSTMIVAFIANLLAISNTRDEQLAVMKLRATSLHEEVPPPC
jgi:hypothetical protein